jgi:hypothetical protein
MLTPAWGWSNSGVECARTCLRTGGTPGLQSPSRTLRSAPGRPHSSAQQARGSRVTSYGWMSVARVAASGPTSWRSSWGRSTRRGSAARSSYSRQANGRRASRHHACGSRSRGHAALPPDWSDLYCELELTSSDHLQRAALLLAPVNPARAPGRSAFRFRIAHTFGYGASPQMTARCFERLDQEGIPGRLAVLHALSDTHNVDTQGPVWRVGGKAV